MINVTLKDVKLTFNSKAITDPAERATKRLLQSFGGYCRAVMRNSIKRARGPHHHAPPGSPPYFHDGGSINYKNTIFFVVDPGAKTVTIGGVLLSGTKAEGKPVPGILEHGSTKMGERPTRSKRQGELHRKLVETLPHPHAEPAFEKAIAKKLPELIKGGLMREV